MEKRENLTEKEQLEIIKSVEKDFLKFWDPNFDNSCFRECRDNFALTELVESVQILKQDLSSKPRFTIAIPTYKRVKEFLRALECAFNQDIKEEYEILVVENTDAFEETDLEKILKEKYQGKINYYKNRENIGAYGNWNRCIELVQGGWVCLLHSDDTITPNCLSEMKKVVDDKRYSDAVIIGTTYRKKRVSGLLNKLRAKIIQSDLMQCENWFQKPHQTNSLKIMPANARFHNREKFLKMGGYNQDGYPTEDQILINRIICNGGKIYTNYKKKLHDVNFDTSISAKPKTILQFIMINPIVFFAFIPDKEVARECSQYQIKKYQKSLRVRGYDMIASHADEVISKISRIS